MDKHSIVDGPEYTSKSDHLLAKKMLLILILFHNEAFLGQSFFYALTSKSDILSQEKDNPHRAPQRYLHYR